MTNTERSLVGIRGWLALYLGILYLTSFDTLAKLWSDWVLLQSGNPTGHLHNMLQQGGVPHDVLQQLSQRTPVGYLVWLFHAIILGLGLVGIWMIHTRRRETRRFFLIVIPLVATLLFLLKVALPVSASTDTEEVLGFYLGILVVMLWEGAWWLYWWRSKRVKQTFATSEAVAFTPSS